MYPIHMHAMISESHGSNMEKNINKHNKKLRVKHQNGIDML